MLKRMFELLKKFWVWLLAYEDGATTKPVPAAPGSTAPPTITPEQVLEIMKAHARAGDRA